jgi:membrane dipeptidase
LDDVSKYPNLIAALIDDGWNDRDIVKIIYGNIMRVLTEVENVVELIT